MLVVVALGGNALLRRGEPADVQTQRRNVALAAQTLAQLARRHRVIVTHGNGPQVGLLALQAESFRQVAPYPLDVLGAESEGMIGYLLEQELTGRLGGTPAATLLTQVVVDEHDPAFEHPTKPIGPIYDRGTAERLARERGWTVAPDGEHWRRVVPSPQPRRIVELQTIRTLLAAGVLVVCLGGGGIPVTVDEGGALHGVEAVIDKDRSAALLAREVDADALLLLTDVPYVERNHATELAQPIHEASIHELDPLEFADGSMRPKIEAAREFVEATGRIAAIGALADAPAILAGEKGTHIVRDGHAREHRRPAREHRLPAREHRLPEQEHRLPELVRLRDGSHVALRPLTAEDEPALRSFLAGMSAQARRMRFFSGAVDLVGAAHLTCATDGGRFGLVAHDETGALVAHALYIPLDRTRAEVAVEVADHLHDRGLGTILIERLAAVAEQRGITHFVAEVLPENHAMLDVFRDGFDAHVAFRDGAEEVELPTSAWRTASERLQRQ